jgi:hypothetical protein
LAMKMEVLMRKRSQGRESLWGGVRELVHFWPWDPSTEQRQDSWLSGVPGFIQDGVRRPRSKFRL